ncbi:MAG: hypothetical protein EBU12_02070 [Microbacteriaceae bacterium]|nr:hypothetical protein [Microbacteriaceae bacterium]
MGEIYPDLFPEGMDKSMVANFVDVAARDLAEVLAPLPSFNCSTLNVNSDKARAFADKRTMIANNYIYHSRLQSQMYSGADWYFTYGFLPIHVEPDFEADLPRIRIEDPMGVYPDFDRFGRCVAYAKRYYKTIGELAVEYPEYAPFLLGRDGFNQDTNSMVEMIRYTDKDVTALYLPSRGNFVLNAAPNLLGKMTVYIAKRPTIDDEMRGQFDDVLYVQLARARFANLAMEAAEKSIQAPLVVPSDVVDLPMGPDSIIRTSNPAGVGRVRLDMPPAAFQEQAALQAELRLGARYPEGRTGNIDASIITGQGVQALLGAFDSQIKAGQTILGETLEDVLKTCFEMDEILFDKEKNVRGTAQGTPYELKYTPSKDIKGDTSIEVRYGLMAGLDPSRALIFSLQALGADLVSKDFIRRELPWNVNVSMEEQRIEIEKMRSNLAAAVTATAQAIPAMAAQGQDPSMLIQKIADVIERRRKGDTIEAAATAYAGRNGSARHTGSS